MLKVRAAVMTMKVDTNSNYLSGSEIYLTTRMEAHLLGISAQLYSDSRCLSRVGLVLAEVVKAAEIGV